MFYKVFHLCLLQKWVVFVSLGAFREGLSLDVWQVERVLEQESGVLLSSPGLPELSGHPAHRQLSAGSPPSENQIAMTHPLLWVMVFTYRKEKKKKKPQRSGKQFSPDGFISLGSSPSRFFLANPQKIVLTGRSIKQDKFKGETVYIHMISGSSMVKIINTRSLSWLPCQL